MNIVIITGNIASDVEAYTTQSGVSRSSFRVAVQRRFRNANGEREADFLNVVAWRSTADFCNKYLKKGSKVAVEGSIQTRSYDAQDGSKRYVTEIIAENVESLSRPDDGNGKPQSPKPANRQATSPAPSGMPDGFVPVDDGDELPFD